jgi:hypothetical protein
MVNSKVISIDESHYDWDCHICGHRNGSRQDYCGCCGAHVYEN